MSAKFTTFVKEHVKCCSCETPLKDSEHINAGMINKYTNWEFPGWGNILAEREEDRGFSRALAYVCDECYKKKALIKFAIEIATVEGKLYAYYHDASKLRDAPQIKIRDD